MNKKRFRIVLVIYLILIIVNDIFYMFEDELANEIYKAIESEKKFFGSFFQITYNKYQIYALIFIFLIHLVSILGLFFMKRWSRMAFSITQVLLIIFIFTENYYVFTKYTLFVYSIQVTIGFSLLVLLYKKPMSDSFQY